MAALTFPVPGADVNPAEDYTIDPWADPNGNEWLYTIIKNKWRLVGGAGVSTFAELTDAATADLPTINTPLAEALDGKANLSGNNSFDGNLLTTGSINADGPSGFGGNLDVEGNLAVVGAIAGPGTGLTGTATALNIGGNAATATALTAGNKTITGTLNVTGASVFGGVTSDGLSVSKNQNAETTSLVSNTTDGTGALSFFRTTGVSGRSTGFGEVSPSQTGTFAAFAGSFLFEPNNIIGHSLIISSPSTGGIRMFTGGRGVNNEVMRVFNTGGTVFGYGVTPTDPGAGNVKIQNGGLVVSSYVKTGSMTVAVATAGSSALAVAAGAGASIYITDESGGATGAESDGTVWRRYSDRAAIS